jgi:hypothetical protein
MRQWRRRVARVRQQPWTFSAGRTAGPAGRTAGPVPARPEPVSRSPEASSTLAARKFEQLFVKQLADDRFEICCIPFFVYDIALLKLGARYYDPTLGRFTQPDPAGQGPNPYAYAGDDPANHTDPTGRFDWGGYLLAGIFGYMVTITCDATVTLATGGLGVIATPACGLAGFAAAGFYESQYPA